VSQLLSPLSITLFITQQYNCFQHSKNANPDKVTCICTSLHFEAVKQLPFLALVMLLISIIYAPEN